MRDLKPHDELDIDKATGRAFIRTDLGRGGFTIEWPAWNDIPDYATWWLRQEELRPGLLSEKQRFAFEWILKSWQASHAEPTPTESTPADKPSPEGPGDRRHLKRPSALLPDNCPTLGQRSTPLSASYATASWRAFTGNASTWAGQDFEGTANDAVLTDQTHVFTAEIPRHAYS